jgi:CRP-like cAMP-binding protein
MYVMLSGTVGFYSTVGARKVFIHTLGEQGSFGEIAMLWRTPRPFSVMARERCEIAELSREIFEDLVVCHSIHERDCVEKCLRNASSLDFLSAEQITRLADTVTKHYVPQGEPIVRQGDPGDAFFIVVAGECKVTISIGQDVQEHRRYYRGDVFGERALLNEHAIREASVIACTECEVLAMTRSKFERLVGPCSALQQVKYMSDPRECIARFFAEGNEHGPQGVCKESNSGKSTNWFAVYRPTSKDAIARMLSMTGVGKGLNVKGKSAKGNRLSGFVPFLQVSNNAHKTDVEKPNIEGWFQVFWKTRSARTEAEASIRATLEHDAPVKGVATGKDTPMMPIDKYLDVSGLMIPEAVVHYMFIHKPDLTHPPGWETGRVSEPAFMDMNLHVLRSTKTDPRVVLWQLDSDNPINPHGLLMAYAEISVKPVVSDFDTFLVGSRGMEYEPLTEEQVKLSHWALRHTKEILENPSPSSWTTRWLEVLKQAVQDGELTIETPKYGFGDATSYFVTTQIIEATRESGAVRHGAECFNFVFPQELDEEYLVIWDGFKVHDKAWEYMDEDVLREFLVARGKEGYAFPLNPVWLVRDIGWYEVFETLEANEETRRVAESWYPSALGIVDTVRSIHNDHPEGFSVCHNAPRKPGRRKTVHGDLSSCERVDLALEAVRKAATARKVRNAAKALSCLGLARRLSSMNRDMSSPRPSNVGHEDEPDFKRTPNTRLVPGNTLGTHVEGPPGFPGMAARTRSSASGLLGSDLSGHLLGIGGNDSGSRRPSFV